MMNDEYIFKESEFEDESFNAAGFITKYRKVSSLDSLKEQLQLYGNSLKQQLYDIINRDYKDFITISTKLDGVDIRVDLLRKPLSSIRMDIASLHDGMLNSMQALEDKLKLKTEVATRRRQLEIFLQCYEDVEIVQCVVKGSDAALTSPPASSKRNNNSYITQKNEVGSGSGRQKTRREMLMNALDKSNAVISYNTESDSSVKKSTNISNNPIFSHQAAHREVFAASELERAAQALGSLQSNLKLLRSKEFSAATAVQRPRITRNSNNSGNTSNNSATADLQVQAYMRSVAALEKQSKAAAAQLVSYVSQRLVLLLSNAMNETTSKGDNKTHNNEQSTGASNTTDSEEKDENEKNGGKKEKENEKEEEEESRLTQRAFAHCLRALEAMGQGGIAAKVLAEQVVLPLAKARLTQGLVDGGRAGSDNTYSSSSSSSSSSSASSSSSSFSSSPSSAVVTDGGASSGRGSFTTLHMCLRDIIDTLSLKLCGFFTVAEEVLAYTTSSSGLHGTGTDLLVIGVWVPVVQLLRERFPSLFSVGIPSTLARSYRALSGFTEELCEIVSSSYFSSSSINGCDDNNNNDDDDDNDGDGDSEGDNDESYGGRGSRGRAAAAAAATSVRMRVLGHPAVLAVNKQWRLDIYMQLRSAEVVSRVDRACGMYFAATAAEKASSSFSSSSSTKNRDNNLASTSSSTYSSSNSVDIWHELYSQGTSTTTAAATTTVVAGRAAATVAGARKTGANAVVAATSTASSTSSSTAAGAAGDGAMASSSSPSLIPSLSKDECERIRQQIISAAPYSRNGGALAAKSASSTAAENDSSSSSSSSKNTARALCLVFATECLTLTHPSVMINPVRTDCLSLLLRLLLRLEAHAVQCGAAATTTTTTTTAFSNSNSSVGAMTNSTPMKTGLASTTVTPGGTGSGGNPSAFSSPAGSISHNSSSSSSSNNSNPFSAVSGGNSMSSSSSSSFASSSVSTNVPVTANLSLEELVSLAHEMLLFENWVSHSFVPHVLRLVSGPDSEKKSRALLYDPPAARGATISTITTLSSSSSSSMVGSTAGSTAGAETSSLVGKIFKLVLPRISNMRSLLWRRSICTVGVECKRQLPSAVKAIAAKFRMTNKPAPETPSPYVGTILAPAENFVASFGLFVEALSCAKTEKTESDSTWCIELVDEICSCFAEQVHLLIDTGKQMDSALQRRSKIRSAAATANTTTNGAGALSDYEKIAMQIQLDVDAFGQEVKRFLQSTDTATADVDLDHFKSYVAMKAEITESVASAAAVK